jgi:hypothetical protein
VECLATFFARNPGFGLFSFANGANSGLGFFAALRMAGLKVMFDQPVGAASNERIVAV